MEGYLLCGGDVAPPTQDVGCVVVVEYHTRSQFDCTCNRELVVMSLQCKMWNLILVNTKVMTLVIVMLVINVVVGQCLTTKVFIGKLPAAEWV